ncbi:MAG: hypothetical protein K2P81_16310 [Bacteriovoracaceae bacterium]|nr:hypothetical protein [Bacteriovoracaceae bacterium]
MLQNRLPSDLVKVIQSIVPEFLGDGSEALSRYAIDSFDLMTLRAILEEELRIRFSDDEWVNVKIFSDFNKTAHASESINLSETLDLVRDYVLNMPQMNVSGLSEYWYLKEIGDMHWRMIAKSLDVPSDRILDKAGNRLYSTFVRIKFSSTHSFFEFKENDQIDLKCEMGRFGNFFLSKNTLKSENKKISAELVTSFVARGKNNSELHKATPVKEVNENVRNYSTVPPLIDTYHSVRKELLITYEVDGLKFDLNSKPIYEMDYHLDPYIDLNGVGLLYFAAYPHIYDTCERSFMNKEIVGQDWSLAASPLSRDTFYLGNVDVKDSIVCRVLEHKIKNGKAYFVSELIRKSDSKRISIAVSIKGMHP